MKPALLLSLSSMLLAACATTDNRVAQQSSQPVQVAQQEAPKSSSPAQTAKSAESDQICHKEKPIGSNRSKTVCYSRAEASKALSTDSPLNSPHRGAPSASGQGAR